MEALCATAFLCLFSLLVLSFSLLCFRAPKTMQDNQEEIQLYSIDAVMYESKKKKNPNVPADPKDLEENVKGKKVWLSGIDNS